jgi:uncharacterized protein (DUF1015 family)
MVRVNPFEAVRPAPGRAEAVAAPPYDVVDTPEARAIAGDNPDCFLRVTRPEIDLPDGTDPYADDVYDRARDALGGLIDRGALVRDPERAIYLYAQECELVGRHVRQVGVVACCHIEDYLADRIRKHEKTRKAKEDDRTRHVLETNANAGPVFLMHKDDAAIAGLVRRDTAGEPLYDLTASDGVRHTVWKAPDPAPYVEAFARHDAVYVADGHHRAASAARAGAERRAGNPGHTGEEEYNWFLTVLFPAGELTILPYHRVVRDLNGHDAAEVLEALRGVGEVERMDGVEMYPALEPGTFGVFVGGDWWSVRFADAPDPAADPVAALDYQRVYDRVLRPIFGIGEIRTDERVDFVGGIRGTAELENRVAGGGWGAAIAMPAVTIDRLMAVSDAGMVMPPKSTWFEPKLRSGLLVHMLD